MAPKTTGRKGGVSCHILGETQNYFVYQQDLNPIAFENMPTELLDPLGASCG